MKREELRAMGLTEDQVNTIMKLNGQDIEAAKSEAATEKARADGLQGQLDSLTTELTNARNEAGNFKDLKAKLDAADAKVKAYKRNDAILTALAAYKPKDAKMLLKLLDPDKIVFAEDDNTIVSGLDEQVKPMKETSVFLFTDAPDDQGGNPPGGGSGGKFDMNALLRGC